MESTDKSPGVRSFWIVTALFAAVKLTLHFLTNTNYELLRDEMLFFNMGEHLSAGYATVPPVTGLLAFLMNKLFGFSVFGIRFFPALMGAASIFIMGKLIREFGGGLSALIIACMSYLLAPGFLLTGTLFTPNSLEELIWLIIMLLVFRMVKYEKPELWIYIGILTGIGFLNKYSIFFLVAGILISFVLTGKWRFLMSKYLIAGIITGLVIISPNLVWQYNHGWPVLIHMSELKGSQLDLTGFAGFPLSLFAFSQGSVLIWLTGLGILLLSGKEREYLYMGIVSAAVLLILFVLKGKGYYALVVLPFLMAFGGYAIEKYMMNRMKPLTLVLLSVSVTMSLLALPSGLPVLSFEKYHEYVGKTRNFVYHPLLVWDNGTTHDFSQAWADMTGWSELAGLVSVAYNSLSDEEKRNCTIFGERDYGYAGAVYFYGRSFKLPEAVTFHESYTFWAPDSIPQGPVIYIYRDANDMNELFAEVSEVGSVDNKYFRETGLKVFLCRSPVRDVSDIYKNLAMEEKNRFSRR